MGIRQSYFFICIWLFAGLNPHALAACADDLGGSHITLEQALDFIGHDSPKNQVTKALGYIQSLRNTSVENKAIDLEILFLAISYDHMGQWDFHRFVGPHKSFGFMGDQGHFVLLHKDGKVMKGRLWPKDEWHGRAEWTGKFDFIEEVSPP